MWSLGSPSTLVSPSLTPGKRKGCICAISSSPDGRFLAILRSSGELQIWRGGTQHVLVGAIRTYHGSNNFDGFDTNSLSSLIRHTLVWRGDSSVVCCYELKSNSLCFFSVQSEETSAPVMKVPASSWSEPQTHPSVTLKPLFTLMAPPSNPANAAITQRTSLPSIPTSVALLQTTSKQAANTPSLILVSCQCGALLIVKFDGSIFRVFPSVLLPNTQVTTEQVSPCFMVRLSCCRQPNGLVLVGAVLSDGRAWAALLSMDLSQVLYAFNLKGPNGVQIATSISVQGESMLAVGWWSQQAKVLVYRLKSDTSSGSTPWKVCEHLSLGLEAWGWSGTGDQPSNVGAAHFIEFVDSDALLVGYTRRGMVAWCPRQGNRLFTTLPDLSPETVHGVSDTHDVRVIPAPAHMSATAALGCGGVSCLALSNQGYQLIVVPAAPDTINGSSEANRDTSMVIMNLLRGMGGSGCCLTSHTCLSVLDLVHTPPSLLEPHHSARFRWRLIPLPPHYAAANAPIRFVASSEQGHVAACGLRGMALLHQWSAMSNGDRWRLFGNAQEERNLRALACAFAGDMVVLCNGSILEVYPRQRLDSNSLIASIALEEIELPRFLQVLNDDTAVIVLVADDIHYAVYELERSFSDGNDLYADVSDNPYQLTKLYEGHFFDNIPKTVLLARKAGRVVVVALDSNGSLSMMDPFENSRQVVAEGVTELWPFPHSYPPLSPMFLLLDRSQYHGCLLRAWVPLLPEVGSPVLIPVDDDEKVLAPLAARAVLVTVRHEVDRTNTNMASSEWHGSPIYEPQPVFRPLLGAALRLLVQEAVKMGAHRKHLGEFVEMFAQNSATQAGLSMALEHLIVDTAHAKLKKELACLLDVVWHSANFCFHSLVSSAARQMDPSRSTLLFSSRLSPEFMPRPTLCHSPATLARDCIARGLMPTAATYLALMGPPEPNTASLSIALEVLEALLKMQAHDALIQDVWAFLGRHVTAKPRGSSKVIVIEEEGVSHASCSRGETLSIFVVSHLQCGAISTAIRPLELIPTLETELLPCRIMSSNSIHQQLLFAFLSIEKCCHISKVSEEGKLSPNILSKLTLLLSLSKATQSHLYHLAAVSVIQPDGVDALLGKSRCTVNPETYYAVVDVVSAELKGYWRKIFSPATVRDEAREPVETSKEGSQNGAKL